VLPIDEVCEKKTNCVLITTKRGGHLGFLEFLGGKPVHFMERFTTALLDAITENPTELL